MSNGVYRRRIRIQATDRSASAQMEDDFHHFAVDIRHDGRRILSVSGHSYRFPWVTCPGAATTLQTLVGLELEISPLGARRRINVGMFCTHQLDIALLACTHAARNIPKCQYDAEIEVDGMMKNAVLKRDGAQILVWKISDLTIVSPEPYQGKDMKTVLEWAYTACSAIDLEAIIVMRRAVAVSRGRTVSLDEFETAARMLGTMSGACYTFQPDTAQKALRMRGTTRQFDTRPEDLLD